MDWCVKCRALSRNKRTWEWVNGNWLVTVPEWTPSMCRLFDLRFSYGIN